ncbi:MAG: hypothetical protein IJR50_06205 [Treponema sp.]|nr:hypothetical protein [Treponema sp.]
MKKKLLVAPTALILFASSYTFAIGLGPQANFNYGFVHGNPKYGCMDGGLALSAKFDALPVYCSFSVDFGKTGFIHIDSNDNVHNPWRINVGAIADYWIMNPEIIGLWHWYWGAGGAVDLGFTTRGNNIYLGFGPRIFIGMHWWFANGFLELYAQQVFYPQFQFAIGTDGRDNGMFRVPIYFPAEMGLRFWF